MSPILKRRKVNPDVVETQRARTMARIDKAFLEWFYAPASWWQFWKPQSGVYGGLIVGAMMALVLIVVYYVG